jgi:cysteine synthase
MLVKNITQLIGNTPLVDVSENFKTKANLYVKVEFFNPGGSVKDRIAFAMIQEGLNRGLIKPTTHIIEASSGNTGVGLAMVCAALNLKLTIIMPETMTIERRKLIKAYGGNLILSDGMKGSLAIAHDMIAQESDSFMPSQFENLVNPRTHRETTVKEILNDLSQVDFFVAGVGTGGTISGVGQSLKETIKDVKIIAVEPANSPMISKGTPGKHHIYGIGAGFIPNTLDLNAFDEVKTVEDEEAGDFARQLASKAGIFVGISSGAAFKVAYDIAMKEENTGKHVVVLLPDTGERYLSSPYLLKEDE